MSITVPTGATRFFQQKWWLFKGEKPRKTTKHNGICGEKLVDIELLGG